MVDAAAHVTHLDAIARQVGVTLPVAIELDLSMDLPARRFGVWRSPVRSAEQACALAARIAGAHHLRLDGLMGYEAQLAGVPDEQGARAKPLTVRALKRRSVGLVAQRRAEAGVRLPGRRHR